MTVAAPSTNGHAHKTRRSPATSANPCPLCDGHDACSVGDDGSVFCHRTSGDVFGYRCCGRTKDDVWTIYIPNSGRDNTAGRTFADEDNTPKDWSKVAEDCRRALTPDLRHELAEALGLPEACLERLNVGYLHAEDCWTFPERDAAGEVIGVNRRYRSGDKRQLAGGRRGLSLPTDWSLGDGPVFLPEGGSDTLALTALGLAAVGRPSNTGGVDLLAALLKDWPPDRPIIIVAENDERAGDFGQPVSPGKIGAAKTAAALAEKLGRPVFWAAPPVPAKDVRVWATQSQRLDPTCSDSWSDAGETLTAELLRTPHRIDPPAAAAEPQRGYTFAPITSRDFDAGDYRPSWLIEGALVANQPGVLGGPSKSLKTGMAVDLVISVASGTPFLGKWRVPVRRRCAILSGESGAHTLQETARRICDAKGIDLPDVDCFWGFDLPQLSSPADMATMSDGLKRLGIRLLVLDPLYLALLSGGTIDAANLYQTGPLLLSIARSCLDVGCTPLLLHHTRKNRTDPNEPLDLEDLAYSGIAEFSRQWLLVNRRMPYEPNSGKHALWLKIGGSTGHNSISGVNIDEGHLDIDFGGRKWDVLVSTMGEAVADEANLKETKRAEQETAKDRRDDAAVLAVLDKLDRDRFGLGKQQVRELAKLSGARVNRAIDRLIDDGVIEETDIAVAVGNGAKRAAKGIRRTAVSGEHTEHTEHTDQTVSPFDEHHHPDRPL